MTHSTKYFAKESTDIDIVWHSDNCVIMAYSRILCFWKLFTD